MLDNYMHTIVSLTECCHEIAKEIRKIESPSQTLDEILSRHNISNNNNDKPDNDEFEYYASTKIRQ